MTPGSASASLLLLANASAKSKELRQRLMQSRDKDGLTACDLAAWRHRGLSSEFGESSVGRNTPHQLRRRACQIVVAATC